MYTKEQNEEIEKVCRVFDSYIRENPYFDVVWSDKLEYIVTIQKTVPQTNGKRLKKN